MIQARYDAARKTLVITAANEDRAALADAYTGEHGGYQAAESLVGEALHEAYDFVRPEDVPGALTDAPILVESDGIAYPDNGEVIVLPLAKVFWFPNYAITDPWEVLKNTGRVEFNLGGPDDPDEPAPPLFPTDLADYLPGGARVGEGFYLGGDGTGDVAALPDTLRTLLDELTYSRDLIDPGYYFVKGAALRGPYPPTFPGMDHALKAGMLEAKPASPEPEQLALL